MNWEFEKGNRCVRCKKITKEGQYHVIQNKCSECGNRSADSFEEYDWTCYDCWGNKENE